MVSVPAIPSVSSALDANLGAVTFARVAVNAPSASDTSLQATEVAQYSKSIYAVLVNGVAAQAGPGDSAGAAVAREVELGPFGAPPPPAGTAAGIPYVAGANHNDFAANVMASLRSLAGNGSIFQG
jgi:hypothetical protein